ncbi:radical SAM additional 4Fe4S-binding domain protein [Caldisphaera lagunensis DSM 15908]|uniref:Radical SAM additional 4Fe4S-binding domain protein n=2 Tax=Caldisphaera lagunensis TaxID=200415 RepID=L0A8V1_CALLD|nr:radical SAM additional 4Fe4S-binding domain protein [Caldisphaera lagunensis DSM 15908]
MIPITVMVTGEGTVSSKIKGHYNKDNPSTFTNELKPAVFWNITYKCNLNCVHCYIDASSKINREELSKEKLIEVANEIVKLELPLIVFTGGEPLYRKEFWDVSEVLANRKKPKLTLSTNGTLITEENAKKLKELGYMYIGISLDSIYPQNHDKFRGYDGAFSLTMKGIENSIKYGIDVGIRTTITKYNVNEIPAMIDFVVKKGIRRISLYLLDTIGRAVKISSDLPTKDQLISLTNILIEKAKEYKSKIEIEIVRGNFIGIYVADKISSNKEDFLKYLKMIQAQGDCGRKTISIYPDGTVRPCQFIDDYIIGDLRKQKLEEILQIANPNLEKFINLSENLEGERCSKCAFKKICGGGSRGRAKVINNNFWGDEPLCFIDYNDIAKRWGIIDSHSFIH